MDSILQSEKECYITHSKNDLHRHHIFFGANRRISEKNGFWVYLVARLHNQSNEAVHGEYGHDLDLKLKRECQAKYEETHTRQEFRNLIGKSYL